MPLAITRFDPDNGKAWDQVTLYVNGLPQGTSIGDIDVSLGQSDCPIVSLSQGLDEIEVTIPSDAPPSAVFSLEVQNVPGIAISSQTFAVYGNAAPARLSVITPPQVSAGTMVTVSGAGLDPVNVLFLVADGGDNGGEQFRVPSFTHQGSTMLRFVLPATVAAGDYLIRGNLSTGRMVMSTEHVTVTGGDGAEGSA